MRPNKRPTIRDVAVEAGVSKSLVSLVYSSDQGVSPERREKVLAAAAKLGFTPNPWARSLATGSANFIGIVVTDLYNPLFIEMADLARQSLTTKGLSALMTAASTKLVDGQRILDVNTVESLMDLKPRGLILIGDVSANEILRNVPETVPVIFTTSIPSNQGRAIVIRGNENEAMDLIIGHLAELGHKSIAYLGEEFGSVEEERISSFKKSVADAKLKSIFASAERSEAAGYAAAKKILKLKAAPTALVCFNDLVAIGAQEAIIEKQQSTGQKTALVGYDNTYFSALNRVSITSVEQGKAAIAAKAAELLTDKVSLEKAKGKTITVHPTLEIRASTISVNLTESE